jgi:hypothetical protein
MKITLPAILVSLLFSFLYAKDPSPPAGFRALFNGKHLAGWYGWNPHTGAKSTGETKEAKRLNARRARGISRSHGIYSCKQDGAEV